MLKDFITDPIPNSPFLKSEQFCPFPRASDRERWQTISSETVEEWTTFSLPFVGYSWPALSANHFAVYKREGNLLVYLNAFWERRSALGSLVLTECLEGEGRLIHDIVNGIMCICEETTWVLPHHNAHIKQNEEECLPSLEDHEVELASSETGALLAITYYLLQDRLDHMSMRIRSRIMKELRTRLFDPYMQRDDYWWMGFSGAPHINNWNPWCNGNMLICFLFAEEDERIRAQGVHKIMRSLDVFLGKYPEDGCCDEGPMYWGSSGGGLYRCLDMLHKASGGRIDIFSDPLVQDIGRYIYRVHIHDHYFVDFADGDAIINPSGIAYGYGLSISDEHLIRLGASAPNSKPILLNWFSMYRIIVDMFQEKERKALKATAPYLKDAWMPFKEVMTAREAEGSVKGLYLAAKGGSNYESHNHNDVGNFIVYADGLPVIIDLGTENYHAQTFSPDRYDLWYLQSQYHNLPTINGILQHEGEHYKATAAKYTLAEDQAELYLDIALAYPQEAGINKWLRQCQLNRGSQVNVRIIDTFELLMPCATIEYNFMTPYEPKLSEAGDIQLVFGSNRFVTLHYDVDELAFTSEKIVLTDERLIRNWGETVYRIVLAEKKPIRLGKREMTLFI